MSLEAFLQKVDTCTEPTWDFFAPMLDNPQAGTFYYEIQIRDDLEEWGSYRKTIKKKTATSPAIRKRMKVLKARMIINVRKVIKGKQIKVSDTHELKFDCTQTTMKALQQLKRTGVDIAQPIHLKQINTYSTRNRRVMTRFEFEGCTQSIQEPSVPVSERLKVTDTLAEALVPEDLAVKSDESPREPVEEMKSDQPQEEVAMTPELEQLKADLCREYKEIVAGTNKKYAAIQDLIDKIDSQIEGVSCEPDLTTLVNRFKAAARKDWEIRGTVGGFDLSEEECENMRADAGNLKVGAGK